MHQLSDNDAYCLRRALARMSADKSVTPSMGVALLINTLKTPQDYDNLTKVLLAQNLMSQVMDIDPNTPPVSKKQSTGVHVPPLPKHAQLSKDAIKQSESVGMWLNEYMKWAIARTPMTPHAFLQSGGIAVIGMAIAGRLGLRLHEEILPHLYILWVASTTRYAKSTGLKTVKHIIERVMPHMLLPEESTPEALIDSLSGKQPENYTELPREDQDKIDKGLAFAARRALVVDEASTLIGAGRKDYMAGLDEILLKGFDAPLSITRSVRKSGLVIIRRPALSILGATAPTALNGIMTWEKWTKGDNARYALLFANEPLPYSIATGDYNAPNSLIETLARLHHEMLPPATRGEAIETWYIRIDDKARKGFDEYTQALFEMTDDANVDERLKGNLGRLPVLAIKVAICLSAIDWATHGNKELPCVVTLGHWAKAQMIAEEWRYSVFRLLVALDESKDYRNQQKIEAFIRNSPSGLTVRDMVRLSGISTKEIHVALESLVDSGNVAMIDHNPSTGRPTKVYLWISQ